MSLFKPAERQFLQGIAKLAYCNHFLPERVEYEKAALGRDFVPGEPVWSASVAAPNLPRPNVLRIHYKLEPLLTSVRSRICAGGDSSADELTNSR